MGSMMSCHLAEKGFHISLWDINPKNVRSAMEMAQQTGQTKNLIEGFYELSSFAKSFGQDRELLLFSISHGHPADDVMGMLEKEGEFKEGDVALDGGYEFYRATERRQKIM
jgi:6-phosphogluconate dehydrogenase